MTPVAYPPQHDSFAREPLFSGLPGDVRMSFEVFPPKGDKGEALLLEAVRELALLDPEFISVTYGAGGSTRDRSLDIAKKIAAEVAPPVAAHLTCVDASRDQTLRMADRFYEAGIRHIVALRGDPPEGCDGFTPHPDGFSCAAELVEALGQRHDFDISVAAYPEVHPEAASPQADIDYLKRKMDAGATRALTQFFFSSDAFLRFRDRAAAAGIDKPIVPGILPVLDIDRTRTFAAECGAHVPAWIEELFEGLDAHKGARELVAGAINAEFCRRLYAEGVRDFHFYTLNRSELAFATCHLLGRRARKAGEAQEKAA